MAPGARACGLFCSRSTSVCVRALLFNLPSYVCIQFLLRFSFEGCATARMKSVYTNTFFAVFVPDPYANK